MPLLTRRHFLLATGAAALARFAAGPSGIQKIERSRHALGTQVTFTVLHAEVPTGERAIEAAFRELNRLEDQLSLYRPESALCRLNRDGYLRAPPYDLLTVLRQAETMSLASEGTFDVTVQPLWEVYDVARSAGHLPDETALAAARARVDWRRVHIHDEEIRLRGPGTRITLNGIAQGYAADRALAVILSHGIEHVLVDTGELVGRGHNGEYRTWQCGLQHPREPAAYVALTQLHDRALATSGDYASTFTPDRRHNHLLDPTTGLSPSELASVSIVARTAMEADALSTACCVLGVERSLALLASRPEVDGFFVTKDLRTFATPGFPLLSEEQRHV